jgi:hypothetical protein
MYMFNLTTVIANSCIESLKAGYRDTYGNLKSDSAALIEQVVYLALENIASSDAPYHNVEHTVLVTLVGQEILRGKYIREGNISSDEWLCAIVSWLCHDIGYVKGICSQDQHSQRLYATGIDSNTIHLELGKTDASLTPHHVDRGKMFIQEHFADRDLIDAEAILQNIELTRFPVPNDEEHSCTANYPGLVRAADLIGQLSDPRYLQKMPALFYEFEEIGTNKMLGYSHPADLRAGYPKFFWNVVYRYIQEGLQFLEMTAAGQEIIANLYGNVLVVEQEIAATAANLSLDLTPNLRPDSNRSKLPILDRFPGLRDRFVGFTQTENRKGFFELFRTKSQLNHPGIRGFQITQRWF